MSQISVTIKGALLNRLDVEVKRRTARTGRPVSRSAVVAKILEEYFRGAEAEVQQQDTVVTGLQNELDTARTQVKTLEDKLATSTGIINDLKADKENLQKQLELVTLRLPAPRVGFWARLFGGGKKE